jgi:sugar O-acyltransferase (sialic acid O-acetyltransferase NeuD family)
MQKQKVVILGAGGFAREVLWVFRDANEVHNRWEVLGFIDENPENHGKELCDLPILGGFEWFKTVDKSDIKVICGVGNPKVKKYFVEKAESLGLEFCSVIHPNVRMSKYIEVGKGTVITAGNIITTQVKIGNHVSLNLDCTIGHDDVIEDYCNIAPGAHISGNVTLKEGVDFGTGAVILQGVTIGKWSIIGAGAVVIDDIPEGVTAVGVPAKVIKGHEG